MAATIPIRRRTMAMDKICIGMFRPLYEDLRAKLEKESSWEFLGRCSNSQITGLPFEELVDHWLRGHFDEPVYRDADERHEYEVIVDCDGQGTRKYYVVATSRQEATKMVGVMGIYDRILDVRILD